MGKRELFGAFLLVIWIPLNFILLKSIDIEFRNSVMIASLMFLWIIVFTSLVGLFTLKSLKLSYSTYFKTIALSVLIFITYISRNTILNKELVGHDFDDTLGAFFAGLLLCGLYFSIFLWSWVVYATKFEEKE
ncbi:MAG: hypothetical protein H0Z18_11105 [Thermococcus sp.]|uniref:hypothetical protein n=1 Tax=Thermococcus sp. TaxID=35749 RepID=UPI001D421C35|nr:hypothetical protein [Thermococcus sp.]MBO8175793.1 hypothetical protein [Thermococcus sp.]